MPVLDQLVYFASLYGEPAASARREARAWLDRFLIGEMAGRRAEELCKGNQQKVQFIAAVLHEPHILLMDEPFTGLDPVNLALLREAFLELRDEGRTLVFSTHQMEAAEALCESLAIVDRGRVVAGGTVSALKRASGRRTIRLSLDDEVVPTWLSTLDGVIAHPAGAGPRRARPGAERRAERVIADVVRRGAAVSALRGRRAESRGPVHRTRRTGARADGGAAAVPETAPSARTPAEAA